MRGLLAGARQPGSRLRALRSHPSRPRRVARSRGRGDRPTPSSMELAWLVLVAVVAGAIAAVRHRRRSGRQRSLMICCRNAGVAFSVLDPFDDSLFLPFRLFGRGEHRGFENVLWDPRDEDGVRVFDYWFEEQNEQGARVKQDLSCAIVPLPFGVPPLAIVPRGTIDVVTGATRHTLRDAGVGRVQSSVQRSIGRSESRGRVLRSADDAGASADPAAGRDPRARGSDAAGRLDAGARRDAAVARGRSLARDEGAAGRREPVSASSDGRTLRGPLAARLLVSRSHIR